MKSHGTHWNQQNSFFTQCEGNGNMGRIIFYPRKWLLIAHLFLRHFDVILDVKLDLLTNGDRFKDLRCSHSLCEVTNLTNDYCTLF